MIGLLLGFVSAFVSGAIAAPPPSAPVDTSSVLDLTQSPEEQMASEGLPATPESGSENPEDLLKSAPAIRVAKKPAKSASARGAARDGLPTTLPLVPGTKTPPTAEPPPALLPLPPLEAAVEAPPPEAEKPTAEALPTAPPAENRTENREPVVAPTTADTGVSTQKWDRSVPLYDRENPSWAVDIHGSVQALGTKLKSEQLDVNGNGTGVIESSSVRNFGLGFEYEPSFLQGIGVVSLGPSFNFYILEPQGDLTSDSFAIYSAGLSLKYQLHFMRAQPVVPFLGFEEQMIHYSFQRANIGKGWTLANGLTFGALIGLNWMEPSAAHSLFAETGIRRSYLVAELKNLAAGVQVLSTDGPAIYFGLRLEY